MTKLEASEDPAVKKYCGDASAGGNISLPPMPPSEDDDTDDGDPEESDYVPDVQPRYMSIDGVNDFLHVEHTDALALGKDGAAFTVSFALKQTQEQGDWRNLIHKGSNDGERTPAIWKFYGNTGFHARVSTTASNNEGIDSSPAVELDKWVFLTYLKTTTSLKMFYDGVEVSSVDLVGTSVHNEGPLFIGKDPWYNGVVGAGFDNIQIHNRELTNEEIQRAAGGEILMNDNLVLAYDFNEGVVDGYVKDLSSHGHNAFVHGNPSMVIAPPKNDRVRGELAPQYMMFDGTDDLITIPHTSSLELGKDGGDFTISFDLLLTEHSGDATWKTLLHKGNVDEDRTPLIMRHPTSN
jgi:hypothetical protein